MKIIDETPDPKVVKRISCGNCGARLEYVPDDVIALWRGKDYSGGSDGAKGVQCPRCGKNVITERW